MTKPFAIKSIALAIALALAGGVQANSQATPANLGFEVGMSGDVSYTGRFPSQAMEEQFNAYLEWVAANNLDVTHAVAKTIVPVPSLDGVLNGNVSATGRFPTQAMEDQFNAYLEWAEQAGLGSDYAFQLISSN